VSVLVAGGTRGIGLELAATLSEPGESVIIGYGSDDASARAACERLEREGRKPIAVRADMGSPSGAEELVAAAAALDEPIRVAVHSTVRVVPGQLMELSDEDLAHTLAVNATSLLWLARSARPYLSRGSSILYLTSRGRATYVAGYELPAGWKLDAAIRYAYSEGVVNWFDRWTPSVVLRVPLTDRWEVHAEYFDTFTQRNVVDVNRAFFSPGTHYLLTKNFEIGLRVGWGVTEAAAPFFSDAGFGWRW